MRNRRTLLPALVTLLIGAGSAANGEGDGQSGPVHPRLFVQPGDREAMREKVAAHRWAQECYALLQKQADPVADQVAGNPEWLTSRMMMNWETHYTLPITRDARWIGGEGRAPVPTPRFAGARDWKVNYRMPLELADWKPYNSRGDEIWLLRTDTGEGEWVHPGRSGRVIERANIRVLTLAARAAFLYWMTGEERYAKVAVPVLWTYMEGFSHVLPPRLDDPASRFRDPIGVTSFEVIHEEPVILLSQCYDFTYHYLVRQGKNPDLIQAGFKRMIDRIIEGGERHSNWNLFQAKEIAYGGLVLEPNDHYADGKGRGYYVDVVLNADLPNQLGLTKMIERGYDPVTALWPEAPGYAFETTANIVEVAALLSGSAEGRKLLSDPTIERAMLAQTELLHPNGLSVGLGDTTNVRINTRALELLIAAAREFGHKDAEIRMTSVLKRESRAGRYTRSRQVSVEALTRYVSKLQNVPSSEKRARSYYARPLDLLMLRLPAEDPEHELSAAMFGTAGNHVHANGLAIELYGAGRILGPNPGRGSSYWQNDHLDYYSQPPAHNTVIPNGSLSYSTQAPNQLGTMPGPAEPAPGEEALSPTVGFAKAGFHYPMPSVSQRRTLALIRTGNKSAVYFDVFRSRFQDPQQELHHDYLFHGMGQEVKLGPPGGSFDLTASGILGEEHGDLRGYDFFNDEHSIESAETIRARFKLAMRGLPTPVMDLWMPGAVQRRIFSLSAPPNRAIRKRLPADVRNLPMPTVLVRQEGEAWLRPFVAVYEPFFSKEGAETQLVRTAGCEHATPGLAAVVVEGKSSRLLIIEGDRAEASGTVEGIEFAGELGVVIGAPGRIDELYLGRGRMLGFAGLRVSAKGEDPISASLRRQPDGSWACSANGEVLIESPRGKDLVLPAVFH